MEQYCAVKDTSGIIDTTYMAQNYGFQVLNLFLFLITIFTDRISDTEASQTKA